MTHTRMDHNTVGNLFPSECFYCGQYISIHIKCALCGVAQYCNQEHQRLHWESHQFNCKQFQAETRQHSVQFTSNLNTSDIRQPNMNQIQHSNLNTSDNYQPNMNQAQYSNLNTSDNRQPNLSQAQHSNLNTTDMHQPNMNQNQPSNLNTSELHQPNMNQNQPPNLNTSELRQPNMNQNQPSNLNTSELRQPNMNQNQPPNLNISGVRQTTMNQNQQQNVNMKTNLNQMLPPVNREDFSMNIGLKSCCTFPIYDMPLGVSKEEIIKRHADYVVKGLNNDGYCVIDGLLGSTKLEGILAEVHGYLDSGAMKDGKIVQPMANENEHIRGDKIVWVSGDEERCRNIKSFMNVLDHLIGYCDGKLAQPIKGRTQAMVACYMGDGVGYKYHIDNGHKDGRCLSCLYYINKDWDLQRDGGVLKLYPHAKSSYVAIEPSADRLLIFWSDSRTPHEVLPPYRKRFAITIWYFDAKEREEVRKVYLSNLQKSFAAK